MDRRKALKNLGLSLGYTVATPTLISIAQSCKADKELTWVPDFFTPEQGEALTVLVDIIIPKTDTPSASEVQSHLFIDRFVNETFDESKQAFTKLTMEAFLSQALERSGKEAISDLKAADMEPVLGEYLRKAPEEQALYAKAIATYQGGVEAEENTALDMDAAAHDFAKGLRGLTILAYKTSEYVGEKVLAYLPVPGEYVGCGDVETLTGGKAWSL